MLGKNLEKLLDMLGKKEEKLGKNLTEIIKLMYFDPSISTQEMSEHIGISPTAIDNNIRQMRDIYIRRIGPRKGGHWEIITD